MENAGSRGRRMVTKTFPPTAPDLARLLGAWVTEATHPIFPGIIVRGTAEGSWLEGERFLLFRARTDHPDFPDSISILGRMGTDRIDAGHATSSPIDDPLVMHYYDSRGVFRVFQAGIDATAFRFQRLAPGFSQRFVGTFADGGGTILGLAQLRREDTHWEDDLRITYRRRS